MATETQDLYSQFPQYLGAADNHNLGNTGTSWMEPQTYVTKLGNAGKFIAASVLSGANSFYQTGVQVANWVGADIQAGSTQDFISSVDSDLGLYYRANKEAVDLTGFVLGSIIPGLGGVKILNAGQKALQTAKTTGFLGGNLGRATGLLSPQTEKYVALAAGEINASLSATKLLNANTLKAVGSGFWQNTLEAAAFETMVQATMFKSPILEQQDFGDILTNVAIGGVVGGTIGAAFNVPKIVGKLKQAVGEEKLARLPFVERPQFAEASSPSEKIAALAWDSEMSAQPTVLRAADGTLVNNNYAVNKTLYEDKIRKNFNEVRTEIHKLTVQGDEVLGNMVANSSTPFIDTATGFFQPGYAQGYFDSFSGALHVTRATVVSPAEQLVNKAVKAGQVPEREIATRYVKILGDDVGSVSDSQPVLLSLADQSLTEAGVYKKVKEFGFGIKDKPLWDASALKGATAHTQAEARQIWASKILKEVPENTLVHEFDLPLLERAYLDGQTNIRILRGEGTTAAETFKPATAEELYALIKESKLEVANRILQRQSLDGSVPIEQGTVAAAKIANTRLSFLEGTPQASEFADLFVHQADQVKYLEDLKAKGLTLKGDEVTDPLLLPKYAKVVYAVDKNIKDLTGSIADAMTYYQAQQKLYQQSAKIVTSKVLGVGADNLPDITNRMTAAMDHTTAGAGFVSFANSNYGTWGSTMQWIGSQVRGFKEAARKQATESMEAALVRVGQKPEAAIEFESVNQKVTRSGKLWIQHEEDGQKFLVTRESKAALEGTETTAPLSVRELDQGAVIEVFNAETADLISAHISTSGKRTGHFKDIRSAQGLTDEKSQDVFRPIRPDLKQYPHFAFVVDPKVTGSGHITMIHAASEKELAGLLDKVPTQYQKLLKTDVEEFKRARQEYEHNRTLHENYLDSELASKGVFSNFFPKSDPAKIVDDVLQQHLRESDLLVTETVRLRYEKEFGLLEDMGRQYSKAGTSRFASRAEMLEKTTDNPYFNHIKTALDISKLSENNLVYGFNKMLDEAVSKFTSVLGDTWNGVKTTADLDQLNGVLDKYGMKPAYYDAALHALANHSAPRGVLTTFVRKANSLLSLFTLGLDPLNSLNNAIGANILRMSELRHLTQAIQAGDTEVAGQLGQLAKIRTPGTGDEILAPTKLVAQAIQNFWRDDGKLIAKYKADGIIKDRVEQLKLLADDFTLKGTETVAELDQRLGTAFARAKAMTEKGETLSGNKLAEEFNRFVSANVMEQVTSIGVSKGLLDEATAKAYVNTFVNRVEGNIVASQRPLVFQGPIGQAIGLFQSYQFNLMQQLFRYVAEGSAKDTATLLGLQSTLYGLQSLPAFQFVNTHIVGQLSGNQEHRDLYDATYGVVGETAGKFMLYGLPSNFLQTNIYSRGDINPRQITILPTSLQEIPLVQGWGKFLANMKETAGKIAGGGAVWESVLQGLEHNGISRPLAGFAQTLRGLKDGQVTSTQNNGNILYQNDLYSFASLTRLAGGRPLDEAITNDTLFRVKTYEAARRADLTSLAERVKTTMIQGSEPLESSVNRFAERYSELGGKQAGFNKWMMGLYKDANVSQAQQLQSSLSSPFAYKMQLLMGGSEE
jgi:hypothetical protein